MPATPRVGLVGPGRTRNGLGPFLAAFLEQAGAEVVAGVGQDGGRTRETCDALGARLGHPVRPFVDVVAMLSACRPDAMVIASPARTHLAALRAGLAAGVHVLCEKPLVAFDQAAEALALPAAFEARRLLLVENCQWPFLLPAFQQLWPPVEGDLPRAVAMGLAPSGVGRAMVDDSLSHFLSVLQALLPFDAETRARDVRFTVTDVDAEICDLHLRLEGPFPPVSCRLELRRAVVQPRAAWIEIDGRRADRRVRAEDYAMSLASPDGRSVECEDPMRSLVYGFATDLRELNIERIRDESERVRRRAILYAEILAVWPG